MGIIPKISEAEWEVMRVFWSKPHPCTANEVYASLERTTDWKPNTVKTLITRLVKKEALGFKENRRVYYYYPLVSEDDCVRAETQSFVNRVFGGAAQPLLVTFLQEEKLSRSEIDALKQILEGKEE
ncbi:MAG: transcriptional regulator [Gracilibacter sp. BRH_c7a]|nr:MAG: transcriptional regulator [Gracilibacter sp. BRH_c7a]